MVRVTRVASNPILLGGAGGESMQLKKLIMTEPRKTPGNVPDCVGKRGTGRMECGVAESRRGAGRVFCLESERKWEKNTQ